MRLIWTDTILYWNSKKPKLTWNYIIKKIEKQCGYKLLPTWHEIMCQKEAHEIMYILSLKFKKKKKTKEN